MSVVFSSGPANDECQVVLKFLENNRKELHFVYTLKLE